MSGEPLDAGRETREADCPVCHHASHREKCRHWYPGPGGYSCDCEHGVRTIFVMHAELSKENTALDAALSTLREAVREWAESEREWMATSTDSTLNRFQSAEVRLRSLAQEHV